MNEIDTLRAEVQELRLACRKMFALIATTLPGQATSAGVLHNMLDNTRAMQKPGEADCFDELSAAALLALSSLALKQHPHDPQVQEIYRGLRPGQRH